MASKTETDNESVLPRLIRIIVFVALIIVSVYYLWTTGEHSNKNPFELDTIHNTIKSLITLDSTVIMEIVDNGKSSILIKNINDKGWINISMPDYTVSMPSISYDKNFIAYLTGIKKKKIIIKDLKSNISTKIISKLDPSDDLSNQKERLQKSNICEWTPLKWSLKNDKIAFFVSYSGSTNSYLVVLNHGPEENKVIWVDSIDNEQVNRKIEWLNNNVILTSYLNEELKVIEVKENIINENH